MNEIFNVQIEKLSSFDPDERRSALEKLCEDNKAFPEETSNVNMHCHSFFSYNPFGWSPARLAWEAKSAGLYAAALCDFDVLEGLNEFLRAGEMLKLRTAVHLETRVFVHEFADKEITSPGEPGVTYIMGAGFPRIPDHGSLQAEGLEGYRARAGQRNRDLVQRINDKLPDIAVDYAEDVEPLSLSGTPTERHIIQAYIYRAENVFSSEKERAGFWASVLGISEEEIIQIAGTPDMDNLVRAKLAKQGGIGYMQPSEDTFPSADRFIEWVLSCAAVPMITWLDGTSPGEEDPNAIFECQMEKGAAALNLIPDRNWNIKDPEQRNIKIKNLDKAVHAAEKLGLPINIGTEMNKQGQPFFDDLSIECLAPYREIFLKGARIMIGHTLLARFADYSYTGEQAEEDFSSVAEKNGFFSAVGSLPPLDTKSVQKLRDLGPQKSLEWLKKKADSE